MMDVEINDYDREKVPCGIEHKSKERG